MKRFTKPVLGILLALVVLVGSYAPQSPLTPKAYAFPVIVVGDVPQVVKTIADGLAWTVAKVAVQSLTQSVVNWINSGFKGSPAFVTDLNQNLSNLSDAVAENFLQELDRTTTNTTGFSIRAPFQDQLNAALREEYYRTTSNALGFNVKYPYSSCTSGRGFSFNSWFCQSQNPANNPYGRYELAQHELFNQLGQETQKRLAEIGYGKGILSFRGSCPQSTPSVNQDVNVQDALINGGPNPTDLNPGKKESNYNCPIRTPGAVIEDVLGISQTSPFRQLELADSVNEIVGALAVQMVNQVLGNGGLSGVSQPTAGGGASPIDRLATSMSQGFALSISQLRTQLEPAAAGWQKVQASATSAKQACANDSAKAAQANQALSQASANYTATTQALTTLGQIEADRARLDTSGTTTSADTSALAQRFNDVLSQSGPLVQGTAEGQDTSSSGSDSLYSQMTALAASCR